ncbi:hypothetical protein FPRO04_13587 [Fusarium proliferatum]|nr:hypothetical protein FPRO04_13587 [Fusarium proliferatum]
MAKSTDIALLRELKTLHVEDLLSQPRELIQELWQLLPVPKPGTFDGDWFGYVHHGNDPEFRADQMKISYNLAENGMFWLGKSYKSHSSGTEGEALNRYLASDGSYKRLHRYKWALSKSKIDGKPAIVGRYKGFENLQGTEWDMCNEMRDLGKGRMLSATYANTCVKGVLPRMRPDGMGSELEFFILTGPVAPWKALTDPGLEMRDGFGRQFSCIICNTRFQRKDILLRHLRDVHKATPEDAKDIAALQDQSSDAAAVQPPDSDIQMPSHDGQPTPSNLQLLCAFADGSHSFNWEPPPLLFEQPLGIASHFFQGSGDVGVDQTNDQIDGSMGLRPSAPSLLDPSWLKDFSERDARYQVNDDVMQLLTSIPLLTECHEGILPLGKVAVQRYIHAYFEMFHDQMPFLHIPTFTLHQCPGYLLTSLCAIGALYCLEPKAAASFHTASEEALSSRPDDSFAVNASRAVLQNLVAQYFAILRDAFLDLQSTLKICNENYIGCLHPSWAEWIDLESAKRAAILHGHIGYFPLDGWRSILYKEPGRSTNWNPLGILPVITPAVLDHILWFVTEPITHGVRLSAATVTREIPIDACVIGSVAVLLLIQYLQSVENNSTDLSIEDFTLLDKVKAALEGVEMDDSNLSLSRTVATVIADVCGAENAVWDAT